MAQKAGVRETGKQPVRDSARETAERRTKRKTISRTEETTADVPADLGRARAAEAARCFKALGEPTRLQIIQFLQACCPPVHAPVLPQTHSAEIVSAEPNSVLRETPNGLSGASIKEICRQVTGGDKISSTFSHHIKELKRAGLIRVEKEGKKRLCRLEPQTLQTLTLFLSAASEITDPMPEGALPHTV
ncbi:MAG: hypothetical protein OHK0029_02870 [Armatimonadaceae bacterium]